MTKIDFLKYWLGLDYRMIYIITLGVVLVFGRGASFDVLEKYLCYGNSPYSLIKKRKY